MHDTSLGMMPGRRRDALGWAAASKPKPQLSGKRILVAEDEYLIATEVADVLEGLGCLVLGPASHLGEATSLARHSCLDGAVLDVLLNGETSAPLANLLRRQDVPFFVVSGFGRSDLPAELSQAPYLGKPFDKAHLWRAIMSAFGG